MSEAFQRLAQNFAPMEKVPGSSLPVNSRQIKSWINELPRGNPSQTAEMLSSSLVSSLAEKLSGTTRLNQLEEVRKVVVDAITWLERQFIGTTMPFVRERLAYAQMALTLHTALADSYRLACYEICSPQGAIPMLKTASVNTALHRSIWHYQQSLTLSWKLYRSSITNVWLGIHRIYQFAKQLKLEKKAIDDPLIPTPVSIHDLYCQIALVSVINPYSFAQTEQDNLNKLAMAYASQCSIGVNQLTEQWTKIPIDADLPVNCNLPDEQVFFFSFQELTNAVNELELTTDSDTAELKLIDGKIISFPVSLMLKVRRNLGLTTARGFTRHFNKYSIETIVGLNTIHYFASGGLDFDTFIQQLPQASVQGLSISANWLNQGGESASQRAINAEVLDHSLAGYRIIWENEPTLRVRVGEVLGLNIMHPEADWMVGIIRWLQYEQNGSVVAGVELLTRRCQSVVLTNQQSAQSNVVFRGLELEPLDEHLPLQFLISGRQQNQNLNQKIEVFYSNEPNRIGNQRTSSTIESQSNTLSSNLEYTLLVAEL